MSLSTSKSKTQLAYTKSGKVITKPKSKNTTSNQINELAKSKHPSLNQTGNIYGGATGQIEFVEQDYTKSLIVKNQRQPIKNQRQSTKQKGKHVHESKKSTQNTSTKGTKLLDSSKKIPIHHKQENKSQAQLLKRNVSNNQAMNSVKTEQQRQSTEISCDKESQLSESQVQVSTDIAGSRDTGKKDISTYPSGKVNPIIEALNNSSSSFAKKLQTFQLQYPMQSRQQRSTHKRVGSKLNGNYFSCQASPKNMEKSSYIKEVVVTTKPQASYEPSASLSLISSIAPMKDNRKGQQENINFLSCLDQYLQTLAQNTTQLQTQNIKPRKVDMKRGISSKLKQVQSSKQYPRFKSDQQQQEETVVLQTDLDWRGGNAIQHEQHGLTSAQRRGLTSAQRRGLTSGQQHGLTSGQQHGLTSGQQQKLIRSLEKQKKKVDELKSIIQLFNQQLGRYKKKQSKMKQNQYHMIGCLKALNQQLTEEKSQRRRLEQVVQNFQAKVRGISRSKDKQRREYYQQEQRPQRKTVYGLSPANNILYNRAQGNFYDQEDKFRLSCDRPTPKRLNKQGKRQSMNRFSMINNTLQDYPNFTTQDMQHQHHYPQERSVLRENLNKNRTQKIRKIISSFELENNFHDQNKESYLRRNVVRNPINNPNAMPKSCKQSYLNSSLPNSLSQHKNSRHLTPNIMQELFNLDKKANNAQGQEYERLVHNYQSDNEQDELQNGYLQHESEQRDSDQDMRQDSESQSQSYQNPNSQQCSQDQQPSQHQYNTQQNNMLIRMR